MSLIRRRLPASTATWRRRTAAPKVFADTIRWIERLSPGTSIEVLIPDFMGNWDALATVMDARPEILNHAAETVPASTPACAAKARYERTLGCSNGRGCSTPAR
ncbi:MAG: hypothetical protein U0531_08510 [Dehalococcoidia bacterium]